MGIIGATVLQTAAINYDMMCVARVVCGVFNGLLTSTVPAYQSECAKPHQRGPLVILSGTLIGFVGRRSTSKNRSGLTPGHHVQLLGRTRVLLH